MATTENAEPAAAAQPEENGDFEFGKFEDSSSNTPEAPASTTTTTPAPETEETDSKELEFSAEQGPDGTVEFDESEDLGRKPPSTKSTPPSQEEETPADAPQEQETAATKEDEKKTNDSGADNTAEGGPDKPAAAAADAKRSSVSNIPSQVEAEVCEAFFEWTGAWNEGNLFGYLDAYLDSDSTRYISENLANGPHAKGGVVLTGRREIDKVFTDIFVKNKKQQEKQRVKKGVAGTLTLRKLLVTPCCADHAIVYGEHQMEVAGDKKGTTRGGVFTVHVQKIDNTWKIISEHATALPKK